MTLMRAYEEILSRMKNAYFNECGEAVEKNEIRAKFENGILKLSVPKKDSKAVEESRYISIEG